VRRARLIEQTQQWRTGRRSEWQSVSSFTFPRWLNEKGNYTAQTNAMTHKLTFKL
jgi:hypothetical protein